MIPELNTRKAELALLGSIINGGRITDITPSDFEAKDTQEIYSAIQLMQSERRKIDTVTLDAETGSKYTETIVDAEGIGFLTTMIRQYAKIVKENSVRRRGMEISKSLMDDMFDSSVDIGAAVENARKQLSDISLGQTHIWMDANELASNTITYLEQNNSGKIKTVKTGLEALDRMIGGLYPGELTIVGAKPGTGKTVVGMLMAINAARKGHKVAVMNLEMIDTQYGSRMISNIGQYDAMKLRKGEIADNDWNTIMKAGLELGQLPIDFLFKSRYIEDLLSAVRNKGDIELLVVDYLQLVRTKQKFESERLRVGHVSLALKELAVELKMPIVRMSQLSRSGTDGRMPNRTDVKETSNLEQDADGIILLHEPGDSNDSSVYKDDKQYFDGWKEKGLRYICMNVEKQRQGSTGLIPILFDASKMRYLGIERSRK